jgi:hypothetical protein
MSGMSGSAARLSVTWTARAPGGTSTSAARAAAAVSGSAPSSRTRTTRSCVPLPSV